jgi:hypothetical protein
MPLLHASSWASWLAGLCALLALGATLSGCLADDGSDETGSRSRTEVSDVATTLQVRTTVSRVQGRLSKQQQGRLERDASQLLAGYLAAAYLHERPADGYRSAFPGFTRGARTLALRAVDTVADAGLIGADEVRSSGAVAFLSVVAPEGRPVGATARVYLDLRITEKGRSRTVPVRGRLMLTPGQDGWRIFGYDLSFDTAARGRGSR